MKLSGFQKDIGKVHLVKGRTWLEEEEVQEIIHQLKISSQDVDQVNAGNSL